ncbi:MAG: hypothetical protein KBS52_03670 [Clostridiales bacterium]|nr:hypothetical protein [Candidatus Equinaster intestinalis]
MKKYETPELSVEKIETKDVIAVTYTEGGDNETNWLTGWASALNQLG